MRRAGRRATVGVVAALAFTSGGLGNVAAVNAQTATGSMRALSSSGVAETIAVDIDQSGNVVGNGSDGFAYRWRPDGTSTRIVDVPARVTGMNGRGQVVGLLSPGSSRHAFVWSAVDGLLDLGTLGGDISEAAAINDSGVVVGAANPVGSSETHAFLWTKAGGMVDLGTLGGASSAATDVNEAGAIVGSSALPGSADEHAFLRTADGTMRDLGTLGGAMSRARAVNAGGQVVGISLPAAGSETAFLWSPDAGMRSLADLGAPMFDAVGINSSGQIAGTDSVHALLFTPGSGVTDLGTLAGDDASVAAALNDAAQVTGSSYHMVPRDNGVPRPFDTAFLWTPAAPAPSTTSTTTTSTTTVPTPPAPRPAPVAVTPRFSG